MYYNFRFVSETMGGSCEKNWLQSFNYELHISNLKKEFNSNLIPIGCVKAGIYYHRALLFKVRSIPKNRLVQLIFFVSVIRHVGRLFVTTISRC